MHLNAGAQRQLPESPGGSDAGGRAEAPQFPPWEGPHWALVAGAGGPGAGRGAAYMAPPPALSRCHEGTQGGIRLGMSKSILKGICFKSLFRGLLV